MDFLIETFQQSWAIRALLASSMVGIMCGVLGCFIVLRNMALIGDALGHAVLPGVVVAFMLVGYNILGFFLGAVVAGLITVVLIAWLQQNVNTKNDAAIGIVFTAMFSIGVIMLSSLNRQGVHLDLKDFLFGTVVGVRNEDLYLSGFILVYVLLSIIAFYRYFFIAAFQPIIASTMGISVKMLHYYLMLLLSLVIVASIQMVGLILVVSMLITPAATALLLSDRLQKVVVISGFVGLLSAVLGLILAIIWETTPGPMMCVVSFFFYLFAVVFAPKKGMLVRYVQRLRLNQRIQLEDTLKQAFRLQEKGNLTESLLLEKLNFGSAKMRSYLNTLRNKGWLSLQSNQIVLTTEGKKQAQRLVRAHRLWETYLVEKMGLSEEQIHEDAEKYEHLLTEEILDEVDHKLGYPTKDPHGSPIPGKLILPGFALSNLLPQQEAKITTEQMSNYIQSQLWELGVLPDKKLSVTKKSPDFLEIKQGKKHVQLKTELAQFIKVKKLSN